MLLRRLWIADHRSDIQYIATTSNRYLSELSRPLPWHPPVSQHLTAPSAVPLPRLGAHFILLSPSSAGGSAEHPQQGPFRRLQWGTDRMQGWLDEGPWKGNWVDPALRRGPWELRTAEGLWDRRTTWTGGSLDIEIGEAWDDDRQWSKDKML